MTGYGECRISVSPPVQAILELAPNSGFHFGLICPLPNRWHRFWQRVFFGFVWKKP